LLGIYCKWLRVEDYYAMSKFPQACPELDVITVLLSGLAISEVIPTIALVQLVFCLVAIRASRQALAVLGAWRTWVMAVNFTVITQQFWTLCLIGRWIINDSYAPSAIRQAHPEVGITHASYWLHANFGLYYILPLLLAGFLFVLRLTAHAEPVPQAPTPATSSGS
jgi:hypothetical protein